MPLEDALAIAVGYARQRGVYKTELAEALRDLSEDERRIAFAVFVEEVGRFAPGERAGDLVAYWNELSR